MRQRLQRGARLLRREASGREEETGAGAAGGAATHEQVRRRQGGAVLPRGDGQGYAGDGHRPEHEFPRR